ncbi:MULTISPECIES: phage holin family protein [Tenebrionibacter/Tenebrionicola group]|jgi:uncharacterized membrane protein HdeD (DUF308 family)|uniref:Phage holin family protein n=2 Tax=Tenebrionibacter/Tenebrionicola group TaxID=2969848 RepID=A0A8K0V268_9ENTR|nr:MULTISPECIES: phage holin family protein [Tenebrionibacter/Tenebrionicola group]MBK4715672.1 phage holin family protein [Tenebrionibacter intestinalis]MBV5096425.1 phage holin family protein [Tenebrionicola larvae]
MALSPDLLTNIINHSPEPVFWLMVGVFSVWGGVVRYLMDNQRRRRKRKWTEAVSQIIISAFTGFLGGLYSFEHGNSPLMALITAGLCSTLGSTLLHWLWRRVFALTEKNP